jgi:S1-C subfamily serine protease
MSDSTPSFRPFDPAESIDPLAASVVGLSTRRHRASGVAWRDGVVVTSAAALWHAHGVSVVLPNGEPIDAELRGLDPTTDLAAIAVPAASLPPCARAQAAPRVGADAFALGRRPSGALQATFGRIGAVGGEWRTWRGGRIDAFIELDGVLRPGFEGAPVADASGAVLGVASHSFTRHTAVAVPAATVERVVDELLAHGRVRRGYLGIAAQPVRATLEGVAVEGLLVSSIGDDGPAARAGLQVGDVIVQAAGAPTPSLDALRGALGAGARVSLTLARGGQRTTIEVEVGERAARGRCG